MLPPRTKLDPDGYYGRLGLAPTATRTEVVKAYRGKARVLHPDVPTTGNTGAFVAVKQAYDVLSSRERRAAYDSKARAAIQNTAGPEVVVAHRSTFSLMAVLDRQPRLFDVPVVLWVALAAFLCLCVYQTTTHLLTPSRTLRADIKPNAATVVPLSPGAHQAVLYGLKPVRLAGTPNFYVAPAASPATLWRLDAERNGFVQLGQLPSFSMVEAVRLVRQDGMQEVLVNNHAHGFVSADRLTPGNAAAARHAYCGYNAGPAPHDGELLERHGFGGGTIELDNRAMQPVVVKLRDETGAVALSVFLGPGGHSVLDGLPDGAYYAEFAIGELWSRACNSFAAGMRAKRMDVVVTSPGDAHLVIAPDGQEPAPADIPDEAYERK